MDEIYTNIKITDFEINNINEIMYPSILSNTVITRRKQEFFLRLQVILLVDLLTSLYHSHYFWVSPSSCTSYEAKSKNHQ